MFHYGRTPSDEQDVWIREHFRSRTAGAEFMLPWTLDTWFGTVSALKSLFTPAELKTIIDAHKNIVIDTSHLRLTHLLIHVMASFNSSFSFHFRRSKRSRSFITCCRYKF